MVNDQEPRYRLVDSNGNVVGSLFQNADGNVEIQDETGTGSVFGPNGIVTPAIDAGSVSTENIDTAREWQDVTSSRSLNTTETNNTASEIIVAMGLSVTADDTEINLDARVDGLEIGGRPGLTLEDGERIGHPAFKVPVGSDYEVNAFGDTEDYDIRRWTEFRP